MSTNSRSSVTGRPLKPPLASTTRTLDRTPLTPRLAPNAIQAVPAAVGKRTPAGTPRIKSSASEVEVITSDNVTPRSAKRRSRVESNNSTPTHADFPTQSTVSPPTLSAEPIVSFNGLTLARPPAVRSPMSDTAAIRGRSPLTRSPVSMGTPSHEDSIDSRFFHASEIGRAESETKKPETKKPAAFFYANGQQEEQSKPSTRATSPARSELRSSTTWPKTPADGLESRQDRATPLLSPALSAISASSPFFSSAAQVALQKPRSPSPSKENIHLSYRKGASQIFGSRPSPIPSPRTAQDATQRRPSFQRALHSHQKSPSLSSIDSGISERSRRRSNTAHEQTTSQLRAGTVSPEAPASPPATLALPNSSMESPAADSGPLSPTRSISELAADARRERKVLDLEISNSSLLAINASLEREVRRQKIELKRFRRLSRAGRLSYNPLDHRRGSGSLDVLNEDAANGHVRHSDLSGVLSDLYDDLSDSDEDSLASGEPDSDAKQDRLAQDERRLRADLDRHREVLVQSQMMNQSLRRCMFATEEMIKEGKKALDYRIRVSDVKLGGRILTGHEDEDEDGYAEEIEVEDEFGVLSLASPASPAGAVEDHAQSFLELWGGVGKKNDASWTGIGRASLGESEGGDRDSGIEVDRLPQTSGQAAGL